MKKGFTTLILGLICGALPLCAGMDESASSVGVPTQPPPALIAEAVPVSPGAAYFWVPGHWSWKGAWMWDKGYWTIRPYPEAKWVPGHWTSRHHGWAWKPGHWS